MMLDELRHQLGGFEAAQGVFIALLSELQRVEIKHEAHQGGPTLIACGSIPSVAYTV